MSKCLLKQRSSSRFVIYFLFLPLYLSNSRPHLLALIQFPLIAANAVSHRRCIVYTNKFVGETAHY